MAIADDEFEIAFHLVDDGVEVYRIDGLFTTVDSRVIEHAVDHRIHAGGSLLDLLQKHLGLRGEELGIFVDQATAKGSYLPHRLLEVMARDMGKLLEIFVATFE